MPPKRKSTTAGSKGAGGKKAKQEVVTPVDTVTKLKEADKGKKKTFKVDSYFPVAGASVYKDFDCMLNQTNIGNNNNKYYVIQVLKASGGFYAWNRWGRVGEKGANSLNGPVSEDLAISDFKKKFKDKTKNDWDKRDDFKPVAGKYVLLEMDGCEDDEATDVVDSGAKVTSDKKVLPCKLDKTTQALIKLIFDQDMFKEAMQNFEIDVKKMPLGKLSKTQIAKGFEVLEEIEKSLNSKKVNAAKLQQLSSNFYTLIPHDFGRQRPPTIQTAETVRQKMDMLLVLADIELAQSMEKSAEKVAEEKAEVPHPLDVNYELLNCDLRLMAKKEKEFQVIEKYFESTKAGGYFKMELDDVWTIDRKGENERFRVHDKLANRKLLWHGTNVAVVAAILKSGLRIMPHSGGRVGQGIYFASENMKSAMYVRPAGHGKQKTGIMFLNEVALGKEHHITRDDSSLKRAPQGFDSIIARGRTEPDPSLDTSIKLDGKVIVVPQGKAIQQTEFSGSSFGQSEYLVYKESQCRMRYLLKFKMSY